ncbi:MAG: ribbon-helix-helix protein, CopG family [Bacillota bacterium]|nr:ribbon-helix-helix protein, CopG family [Bacillota bacterium]
MTRKILNISLPEDLYSAVSDLAVSEKKSKAEMAREIIREYITKRERWVMLRQWGQETADKLVLKDSDSLDDLIHDTREELS